MLYYKKSGVFIKLIPDTKTFTEVFTSPEQCRIMNVQNEVLYSNTAGRVFQHQFEEATEAEFTTALQEALERLGA
jgi:hypothetical protein